MTFSKLRNLALLSALSLVACDVPDNAGGGGPQVAPVLTTPDAVDDQSFARPLEARVVHVDLDLDLDFDRELVAGTAMLDVIAKADVDTIVLDSDGLDIASITDKDGRPLPFEIGARVKGMGEPVTVTMGQARELTIGYSASEAEALQWLTPEQTLGGEKPYLFSQGQPILNRTWIPTQDSPGIRQTWSARITAPADLTVVMSGLSQGEPEKIAAETIDEAGDEARGARRAFSFAMDKPVAPYLIAIAAGDIVFRELGPRSGVWSEPAQIEAAAAELSDTEALIDAAEALYGSYRWGRYDMIVLPPAFPYGGMENPVMNFLTPTFIAGDKSNNGLIAHELAHSWSGNLVTNAVWGDGWLNEGVTSYFENRIVEEVYGKKRAEQEAALSFTSIEETLADVGEDAPGTALHNDGQGELVGSAIAYDKGAYFMRTVEHIVGRERFDAWLRQWFDNHAFQPATSAMMLSDMQENLVADEEEAEALMLREWIFEPGLPSNVHRPNPKAFAEVDAAAKAFTDRRELADDAWQGWTSAERQRFLANLPRELDEAELAALDEALRLSDSENNEILFLWLELALENRNERVLPLAEEFLTRVGRAKFVRPLFATLAAQGDWGRRNAQRIYAKARPRYHSITQLGVDRVLGR